MTVASSLAWREAVGVLILCVVEGLRSLREFRLWRPLLPWLGLKAGAALWLGGFPAPPRDRCRFLWEWVGGESATHFPESSAVLPRLMVWLDPGFECIAGLAGLALTCAVLPIWFGGGAADWTAVVRRVGRRIPAILVVMVPGVLLAGGLVVVADSVREVPPYGVIVSWVATLASLGIRVLLAYVIASVVIGGLTASAALRRSVSFAGEHFPITFALVCAAAVVRLPWRASPEVTADLFTRTAPEWGAAWLAIGSLVSVLVSAFVLAATTRLYLHGFGTEDDA